MATEKDTGPRYQDPQTEKYTLDPAARGRLLRLANSDDKPLEFSHQRNAEGDSPDGGCLAGCAISAALTALGTAGVYELISFFTHFPH